MTSSATIFQKMSGAHIEKIGLDLIKKFQPGVLKNEAPFDIEHFVDVHLSGMTGVEPDYLELPPEIYGLTDPAQNRMMIQADLADDPFNEKFLRSTLAHEVGHCLLHVPLLRRLNKAQVFKQEKGEKIHLYRKANVPVYQNPEWQAWRLAGAVLMPKEPVIRLLNQGAEADDLAKHFNVHQPFVMSRLRALKILV